jgi:hypothetical protein
MLAVGRALKALDGFDRDVSDTDHAPVKGASVRGYEGTVNALLA